MMFSKVSRKLHVQKWQVSSKSVNEATLTISFTVGARVGHDHVALTPWVPLNILTAHIDVAKVSKSYILQIKYTNSTNKQP